jgi:hypothetical protein
VADEAQKEAWRSTISSCTDVVHRGKQDAVPVGHAMSGGPVRTPVGMAGWYAPDVGHILLHV